MLVMLFLYDRVVVDYQLKYDVHITLSTFNKYALLFCMTCLTMHKSFKEVK